MKKVIFCLFFLSSAFSYAEEGLKDIKKELSEVNSKINTELGHVADKIENLRVKAKKKNTKTEKK